MIGEESSDGEIFTPPDILDAASALTLFILTTTAITSMGAAIMMAFPSVLIPALLSTNNTDIHVTQSQISWLAASNGVGGMIGFFVLSPVMQLFGRKVAYNFTSLFLIIGWIILAPARSSSAILAARIIQGFAFGGYFVHAIIICEYADPKRRGYFMAIKKAAAAVGVALCHALSLIWNWRQIATCGIIITLLPMVLVFIWPESPSYLAMKHRFKESEKSFVWLHGRSNLQELHLLHLSQQQKVNKQGTEKWYKFLLKKEFFKSLFIVTILLVITEVSGRHYLVVYVIQMMIDLVQDKSSAIYFSLGADIFTVVALMSSSFIIKNFKRRTILFSFGVTTIILMLLICSVIIIKSLNTPWVSPLLIVLHSFIVNISIIPLCFTLMGEIFPLEYKGYGSFFAGLIFTFLYSLVLGVTPAIIKNTGVGGIYVINGLSIAVCLLVLYFILPETRDKTLQEIENELKGVSLPNYEISPLQTI